MVNREDCVRAINQFIEHRDLNEAIILIKYLAELNNSANMSRIVEELSINPTILTFILDQVIVELERKLNIYSIIDQYNNIIIAY
jgi:hypothetical protein